MIMCRIACCLQQDLCCSSFRGPSSEPRLKMLCRCHYCWLVYRRKRLIIIIIAIARYRRKSQIIGVNLAHTSHRMTWLAHLSLYESVVFCSANNLICFIQQVDDYDLHSCIRFIHHVLLVNINLHLYQLLFHQNDWNERVSSFWRIPKAPDWLYCSP